MASLSLATNYEKLRGCRRERATHDRRLHPSPGRAVHRRGQIAELLNPVVRCIRDVHVPIRIEAIQSAH